ncbi:hypothetical protein D3C77_571570 [compost metagenome]
MPFFEDFTNSGSVEKNLTKSLATSIFFALPDWNTLAPTTYVKDSGSPLSDGILARRTSNLGDVPFSMFVFMLLKRIGFVKLMPSCWFWNMAFASLEDTDSAPGFV